MQNLFDQHKLKIKKEKKNKKYFVKILNILMLVNGLKKNY